MPPLTRGRSRTTEYILLEDIFVSKHLAHRIYDLERETNVSMTCAICLEVCDCRHCAAYLRCGHGCFHHSCITSMADPKCPICRQGLV